MIPSHCVDECDEQVVRVLYYDVGGKGTFTGSLGETSCGWHQQYTVPTSAGDVNQLTAKTLGVAGEQRTYERNMGVWCDLQCLWPVWTSKRPLTMLGLSTWPV